jgi:hypothetical protein
MDNSPEQNRTGQDTTRHDTTRHDTTQHNRTEQKRGTCLVDDDFPAMTVRPRYRNRIVGVRDLMSGNCTRSCNSDEYGRCRTVNSLQPEPPAVMFFRSSVLPFSRQSSYSTVHSRKDLIGPNCCGFRVRCVTCSVIG